MVNFAVKEQGLEAQLLGIVVRKEKPQLEEQKDELVMTIATGPEEFMRGLVADLLIVWGRQKNAAGLGKRTVAPAKRNQRFAFGGCCAV